VELAVTDERVELRVLDRGLGVPRGCEENIFCAILSRARFAGQRHSGIGSWPDAREARLRGRTEAT